MARKLIDLTGLSQFLVEIKNWVENYFNSRIDKTINKNSDNPVANSVVSKAQWKGTSAEIDAAIANGDIIPGYTNVIVTDDDDVVYEWCTREEIYALFGLTP